MAYPPVERREAGVALVVRQRRPVPRIEPDHQLVRSRPRNVPITASSTTCEIDIVRAVLIQK